MSSPTVETRLIVKPVYFKCNLDYATVDGVTFMWKHPKKVENKMTIEKLRKNKNFVEIGEKLPEVVEPVAEQKVAVSRRQKFLGQVASGKEKQSFL